MGTRGYIVGVTRMTKEGVAMVKRPSTALICLSEVGCTVFLLDKASVANSKGHLLGSCLRSRYTPNPATSPLPNSLDSTH